MSDQWAENEEIKINYAEIDKAIEQVYKNDWWKCGLLMLISCCLGAAIFGGFVLYLDWSLING